MKNLFSLTIIFTSLLFSSCKKERTCTCTQTLSNSNGSNISVSQSTSTAVGGVKITGGSRKNAKKECENFENNINNQYKTSKTSYEASCEIVDIF